MTARRREESLQETPISISAFGAGELRERSVGDVSGIADFVPNVQFDATAPLSGASNAGSIFIRGVGQTDFVFTTDPGVGVYLDGVYISRSVGSVLELMDLERIEILRGPQGTLFGKNTIGGAINVTSAQPTDELEAGAELTIGRFDRREARGFISGPLTDTLSGRISLAYREADGYAVRLLTGEGMGGYERLSGRAALRFTPSDDVEASFAVDFSTADDQSPPSSLRNFEPSEVGAPDRIFAGFAYNNLIADGPGGPNPFGLPPLPAGTPVYDSRYLTNDPYTSYATGPTGSEYDILGATLTVEFGLGPLRAKSISAYRELESAFGRDPDGSPLELVHTSNEMEHEQWSQELQLSGSALDDRLTWVGGLYYLHEEGSDRVTVPFAGETFRIYQSLGIPIPNVFGVSASGDGTQIENDSYAAFAEADVRFTERLSGTLGLRWTKDEKLVDLSGYLIGGAPAIAAPVAEESFTEVTPRAGLTYEWSDDVRTYLMYSEGFKSGGFNPRYGLPLDAPTSFEPERVKSFELGVKSELADRRVRLNGAAFVSDYEDIQVVVFDNGIPRTINAAKGEIRGLELELTVAPTSRWAVHAAYGYTDAEYTRLDPAVIGSFGTPIVNPITRESKFVNTPEHSGALGLEFRAPLGRGTLTARGDLTYRSEVANDAINTPELIEDDVTLLGARLAYATDAWEVALFGTNLTDERYITSGVADEPGFGLVEVTAAPPRQYGVTVAYHFGAR